MLVGKNTGEMRDISTLLVSMFGSTYLNALSPDLSENAKSGRRISVS
jgi:hypothetical protein